ncbi:MAG: hypothetical protein KJO79_08765 [Verrucomicrobiae bacterium]|nr:hypothetical protein [Verrucomicrobiae bacterium]NNJ87259.1 hypothetical protein [Akkermansiaceae bacterium]
MTSQHQQAAGSAHPQGYPEGRVDGPALLYGGVGLALSVAMQVIGLFKKGDARLLDVLIDPVFNNSAPDQLSMMVLVPVTAFFCFGIAFAVLDSAGMWRRVILGVTAFVVVIAMVPTLAVWDIYFSPFLPAVGIFWTWFCTLMYVNHHVMPCEFLDSNLPTTPTSKVSQPEQPRQKKPKDPNAKYAPKNLKDD